MPDDVDENKIKAQFKEGMINVTLPKSAKVTTRVINVAVTWKLSDEPENVGMYDDNTPFMAAVYSLWWQDQGVRNELADGK